MIHNHIIIHESEMDSSLHKELPALLAMAHDRSEEGRLLLAGKLSEVFINPLASLTHKEETLVAKLIEDLITHENVSVRQALISEFAKAVQAPREIAVRIAQGPIEIARDILMINENLSDDDLIMITKTKPSDHALAIASRASISEAVADALMTTGSLQIMSLVAENLGAHLSPHAVEVMVEAARLSSVLQKPILARPELTADSAMRLFWWVEKDLRRATMERFGYGPGRLEAALDQAVEEKLKAHIFESGSDEAMLVLADWLEERDALTTKLIPPMLRMGHYRLFNITLSRLNRLDLSLIDVMTEKAESRMLVALCRALAIDKGAFISIFLMARGGRPDEQVVHPRELSVAVQTFDRLTPVMAEAMVQSWRVDPSDVYRIADAAQATVYQA